MENKNVWNAWINHYRSEEKKYQIHTSIWEKIIKSYQNQIKLNWKYIYESIQSNRAMAKT